MSKKSGQRHKGKRKGQSRPHDLDGILREAAQHHHAGRNIEAAKGYRLVLSLKPNLPEVHNHLGIALMNLGRLNESVSSYQRAIALVPNDGAYHRNVAIVLSKLAKFDAAVEHYERSLALTPDSAEVHNDLGIALMSLGRLDEAAKQYDRAIELNPVLADAHYNRTAVSKFHEGDERIAALRVLAVRTDLPADKMLLFEFALARALEKSGDDKGAFEQVRKGSELKRKLVPYYEPGVLQSFRHIAATFDRAALETIEEPGDPSNVPIFIVGMPRSGSTLVEQILASHPQVFGAGELNDLARVTSDPKAESLSSIAKSYLASLPVPSNGETRIVDKQLDNFLRIGTMRMVFPNAKIIHTMRNPLDTCVSCYSTLFTMANYFTYDLAELGRYYRAYVQLMAHWRSVLPAGSLLDVVYEDVVDDLEGQARRLIDYLGLPWDDRCLSFHTTKRAVTTASATQVREPLFRRSLGRWQRHEAELGPLLRELGDLIPGNPGSGSGALTPETASLDQDTGKSS